MKSVDIVKFATNIGLIKKTKRSGWLRYLQPSQVQSVADHSCRIGLLTLALASEPSIDYKKCLELAIIHDLAEGITGDFTPYDKITSEQKLKLQQHAMERIFSALDPKSKQYFYTIWRNYQDQQTLEAKLVKDLDKYEMMQQAYEYEQQYKVDLSEFFKSYSMLKTDIVKGWAEQLLQKRNEYQQNAVKAEKTQDGQK